MSKEENQEKLQELENKLQEPDFWTNKEEAQKVLKEIREIKAKVASSKKYDKGDVMMSIYAGAGGEDAEDWAKMLFEMYHKFADKKGWSSKILHEHRSDYGGLRNITFELSGKDGVYGQMKGEMGVHRLVRVSPFSSKKLRHTSFAMVEVMPRIIEDVEINLKKDDLEIDFARSSGPGGQNVNKRSTAVRIKHKPTDISVHVEAGRSQAANREIAMELLKSKLFNLHKKHKDKEISELKTTTKTAPEWGNQIRSYVLHPYKMVKDHRTDTETSDVDGVLGGDLEEFTLQDE